MDNDATIVRPARPADLDAVWALVREFATSYHPDREAFIASFDALVREPATLVLIAATERSEVVGYLLAGRHLTFHANGPVVWIEEVMVDARHRRAGVGRTLMDEAERWGRAHAAAYVALASRRAGRFYLALGYADSAVFYRKLLA